VAKGCGGGCGSGALQRQGEKRSRRSGMKSYRLKLHQQLPYSSAASRSRVHLTTLLFDARRPTTMRSSPPLPFDRCASSCPVALRPRRSRTTPPKLQRCLDLSAGPASQGYTWRVAPGRAARSQLPHSVWASFSAAGWRCGVRCKERAGEAARDGVSLVEDGQETGMEIQPNHTSHRLGHPSPK
jgi:hypothetical protein